MANSGQPGRFNADVLRNADQVGFVRFEESDQRREQHRVIRPQPKLVCPDSGQVEEPASPPLVGKRCSQGC